MAEEDLGIFEIVSNLFYKNTNNLNDRVRDSVRMRSEELARFGHRVKRIDIDPQVDKMRRKLKRQVARIDATFARKTVVNEMEKLWYTASLLNIFGLGIVLARFPEWLHVIYTVELLFLLPIRFYTYHKQRMHYFLADLCYYANAMLLLFLWWVPDASRLWVSIFAFSFGSLAISVALWRNSLVMQSTDKTTSTFIHIMPPVVCYTINFRLDPEFKVSRFPGAYAVNKWEAFHSIMWTTVVYFVWQALYHYFITVRRAAKIKAGSMTSFEFMRKRYAKTRLGHFVNGLPGPLPVLMFTLIQFLYQLVTMIPCPLYYRYESLSVIVLLAIFSVAAYNGATYYIDVYGERFHKEVKQLQAALDRFEEETHESDDVGSENEMVADKYASGTSATGEPKPTLLNQTASSTSSTDPPSHVSHETVAATAEPKPESNQRVKGKKKQE